MGFPLEKVELQVDLCQNVKTIMQSGASQTILQKCIEVYNEEPVIILFIEEWQDDYDPHSFSKLTVDLHGLKQ